MTGNKYLERIFFVALALAVVFSLTGCKKKTPTPNSENESASRTSVDVVVEPNEAMMLELGVGIGPVKFGMSKEEVISHLGPPDINAQADLGSSFDSFEFMSYGSSKGFDLFLNSEGAVDHIICNSKEYPEFSSAVFAGRTKKGLAMGDSYNEIVAAYGKPDTTDFWGPYIRTEYDNLGTKMMITHGRLVGIEMMDVNKIMEAEEAATTPEQDRQAQSVEAPDHQKDKDSTIPARGEFSISGTVVDLNDKPVAHLGVYCLDKNQSLRRSVTNTEGRFTIDGIFKGRVKLMAGGHESYGHANGEAGATNVKVVLDSKGFPKFKGRACFPTETSVWVNGMIVPISEVSRGRDAGYISCAMTGEVFGYIEKIEEHEGAFECRDILLDSGNRISVVDSHYFLPDSGRWITAQNLRAGWRLKTITGTVGIKSVTIWPTPYKGKVYNLNISHSDQYAVGKDGVIVRDY